MLSSAITALDLTNPFSGQSVMSTTIKDVAELAAVSTATVSRVVNGTGNVSGETRTRVLTAISSLQYYPNAHAAELGRTRGRGLTENRAPVRAQVCKKAKPPCYPRGRIHHEETPRIESVGRQLRVWRDQRTNKILIEPPVFAPKKESDELISLSAKHARHLASSLLLFAEEAESSPTFAAVKSRSQVAQEERAISRLEGTRLMLASCKSDHFGRGVRPTNHAQQIRPIERPRGRKKSAPYL